MTPTPTSSPTPTPPPANNVLTVPTEYPTIQAAIDAAQAGDYVEVYPGVYNEELHTVRAGVSIVGHAGAILEGNGTGRPSTTGGSYLMVEVLHDDTFVQGFEVRNSWRGVRCDGADRCRFGGLTIHNIGRTGIEISHNSVGAEVHGSHIYDLCQANEGNCEAIYIGTARSASSWDGPDLTRDGIIAGNLLGPNIAEGVDLKDDVASFVIRDNEVTGAGEPNSGALNIRGHHNSLLRNYSHDNDGSGFRFGGTSAEPATDNVLRDNRAEDNGAYGYKFIDWPQDTDGSNACSGNGSGCATGGTP